MNRNFFPGDINGKEQIGDAVHFTNTTETAFQPLDFPGHAKGFFFGEDFKLTPIAHAFQTFQFGDPLPDGLPVSQGSTQPAADHVGHANFFGVRFNNVLGLPFCAYK